MSRKEELLKRIADSILLDNTRVIFDGVKQLAQWAEGEVTEVYVKKQHDNCKDFYHNPLSSFFRFMGDGIGDATIAAMVRYFICVTQLYSSACYESENSDSSYYSYDSPNFSSKVIDDPYGYEELCDLIRDITGYDDCYLVQYCFKSVNLLVSSAERVGSQYYEFKKTSKEAELSFCEPNAKNGYKLLVVRIDIKKGGDGSNPEDAVYIVLRKRESGGGITTSHDRTTSRDSINIVRNLLFLRERLSSIIQRDLHALIRFRSTYGYIKSLNGSKETVFLHLSDMHIDNKKNNEEKITKLIEGLNLPYTIDLILITGDVAQGDRSAHNFEENYKVAGTLIKKIAMKVWGDGDYLRQDWRKRIVIIPGNHDYATMTDIETVEKKRETASGTPSDAEGTTMAQFSYFIDFLQDLLNIDISEYIHNDLNEIRHYEKLNTDLICLHSATGVGPIRSNKVRLSGKAMKRILNKYDGHAKNKICLVHHTPAYSINYVQDMYFTELFASRRFRGLIKCLEKLVVNGIQVGDPKFGIYKSVFAKSEYEILKQMIAKSEMKILSEYFEKSPDIKVAIANCIDSTKEALIKRHIINAFHDSTLYKDMEHCLKAIQEGDTANERVAQIKHAIINAHDMSENDRKQYNEQFEIVKNKGFNIVLGGHRHFVYKSKDNIPAIYEAEQFYKNNSDYIAYSILRAGKYQDYQHKG